MTCQDRDPELLLFGLGELPLRQRWKTARHLRTCVRCRARLRELTALSGQIAAVLRPPEGGNGRPGGPGSPAPLRSARRVSAPFVLALVLSLLTIGVVGVWYLRLHPPIHRATGDDACRPGLPNDKCR